MGRGKAPGLLAAAAKPGIEGQTINLAQGSGVTIGELAEMIASSAVKPIDTQRRFGAKGLNGRRQIQSIPRARLAAWHFSS